MFEVDVAIDQIIRGDCQVRGTIGEFDVDRIESVGRAQGTICCQFQPARPAGFIDIDGCFFSRDIPIDTEIGSGTAIIDDLYTFRASDDFTIDMDVDVTALAIGVNAFALGLDIADGTGVII